MDALACVNVANHIVTGLVVLPVLLPLVIGLQVLIGLLLVTAIRKILDA